MANGRWPAGFSRWLFRYKGTETPMGDLARDAYIDDQWPIKSDQFFDYYSYLNNLQVPSECISALFAAWQEYKGVDFERVFLNRDKFYYEEGSFCVSLSRESKCPCARSGYTYIYVLHRDYDVYYVGQTIKPQARLRQHVFNSHSIQIKRWADKLLWVGEYPLMGIIDEVEIGKASIYEEAYIKTFDAESLEFDMLNIMQRGFPNLRTI